MPSFIVKLAPEKYVEWSTVVDAPVTYILTREHMLDHLDYTYGTSSIEENRRRLDRADANGTSCHHKLEVEELLSYNRAGENEKNISLEEILERYDLKNA